MHKTLPKSLATTLATTLAKSLPKPLLLPAACFACVLAALPAAAQPAPPAPATPDQARPAVPGGTIPAPNSPEDRALREAATRYPPLILGPGLQAADGTGPVPAACGAPGGVVEGRGIPAFIYRGADPAEPELCNMSVGGENVQAWFGIWLTSWPGADTGRNGLRQVMEGKTGDIVGFDTVMSPQLSFHDFLRNEGIEQINLLGYTYTALKISHYREGFNGNSYRSVATVWKDFPTGMILYATYQHISGTPVVDDPLEPTTITLPP